MDDFEIVWSGSFDGAWWREYSDAPAFDVNPERSVARDLKAQLQADGRWLGLCDLAQVLGTNTNILSVYCRRLIKAGLVERQLEYRKRAWPRSGLDSKLVSRYVYRWIPAQEQAA